MQRANRRGPLLAARQCAWVIASISLLVAFALPSQARAAEGSWNTWHTAKTVQENGNPVFTVDGKAFFVYGAAFFYERIPRDQWERDLQAYKALGINTIDLYLIWNWHEPTEGTIDFTGETNPSRDLHTLFSLIHEYGFKVIVRPGPVIRNEWKNGGYPDWLLKRPEYNMPLHDILEGRYPATATLQNAHADAAATEWMANATHERESAAWLRTVLMEIEPWSHDVLAIALDDDQGAYIDNDTWPAPHWHDYIKWLKLTVQQTVGPRVPLFINTYQMKVTASAPIWAWGNWYQSDAYRIGDHDIDQLMFSTALLQTQPNEPVMASEFQAGWLQGADEIAPRAAAPENTTLALHELLQMGAHGVVNFPVQDTFNPPGWEAPWANWSYAWDAALTWDAKQAPRSIPTQEFGSLVSRYGPLLATMHPKVSLQIAWLVSAFAPESLSNADIANIAAITTADLQECRERALTCSLVDLKYSESSYLAHVPYLVVPSVGLASSFQTSTIEALIRYRRGHGHVISTIAQAQMDGAHSWTQGVTDATLLVTPDESKGILDVFNAGQSMRTIPALTFDLAHHATTLPSRQIGPGDAADLLLNIPTRRYLDPVNDAPDARGVGRVDHDTVQGDESVAYRTVSQGYDAIRLENASLIADISPDAGARVFFIDNEHVPANVATTIGDFRDGVQAPPTPSPRDYIAAYTHPINAGTFNRPYACAILETGTKAVVRCTYDAPDLGAQTVHFEKTFTLDANSSTLLITLQASVPATSISAILDPSPDTPKVSLEAPSDAVVTNDQRKGYRIVTIAYPANTSTTLRLTTLWAPLAEEVPIR